MNSPLNILEVPAIVSDDMRDFISRFLSDKRSSKFITPMVLLTEHKCPICNKYVHNIDDIEFLDKFGMCIGCDHVLDDGWKEYGNE